MSKQKVHVIGESLSSNIGDRIIALAICKIANDFDCHVVLHDLSRSVSKDLATSHIQTSIESYKSFVRKFAPSPLRHVVSKSSWLIKNFRRIREIDLKQDDIILFGGGQLLMDNGNFPFYLFIWVLFTKYRCQNTYLFCVGANGPYSVFGKILLKNVIKSACEIYVRDTGSVTVLKSLFNVDAKLTKDAAYYLYDERHYQKKPKLGIGLVCKSVFEHYNGAIDTEEYYQLFVDFIEKYRSLNPILVYSVPDDRIECLKFQNYYRHKFQKDIPLMENSNAVELFHNLEDVKVLVAGRMHMLISGELHECEVKPIPISEKLKTYSVMEAGKNTHRNKNIVETAFKEILNK